MRRLRPNTIEPSTSKNHHALVEMYAGGLTKVISYHSTKGGRATLKYELTQEDDNRMFLYMDRADTERMGIPLDV